MEWSPSTHRLTVIRRAGFRTRRCSGTPSGRWLGRSEGIHGLVAHSMGALATPWAITRGLEINRVVFVAPGFSPNDATARMAEALGLSPLVLAEMRRRVSERVGRPWPSLVDEVTRGIETPLLVIHDLYRTRKSPSPPPSPGSQTLGTDS